MFRIVFVISRKIFDNFRKKYLGDSKLYLWLGQVQHLVSVKMIVSLGGYVKPLILFPSLFRVS